MSELKITPNQQVVVRGLPKVQNNVSNIWQNSFKGDAKVDKFVKADEVQAKPKSSTGKKIGTGLASLIVPGLGQATNGQWGKALGFFLGVGLADTLGFVVGGPIGAIVAHTAVDLWNVYDAMKNA